MAGDEHHRAVQHHQPVAPESEHTVTVPPRHLPGTEAAASCCDGSEVLVLAAGSLPGGSRSPSAAAMEMWGRWWRCGGDGGALSGRTAGSAPLSPPPPSSVPVGVLGYVRTFKPYQPVGTGGSSRRGFGAPADSLTARSLKRGPRSYPIGGRGRRSKISKTSFFSCNVVMLTQQLLC